MRLKYGFEKVSVVAATVVAVGVWQLSAAEINVKVDGMVCYSCAFGIQKMCKMEKIGKNYEKDIEKGSFKITLAENEQVPEPGKLKEIVHNAGYTYRGAHLEIKGKVLPETKKDMVTVRISQSGQVMLVSPKPGMTSGARSGDSHDTILVLEATEGTKEWTLGAVKAVGEVTKNTP